MTYCTPFERQHTATVNAGEADAERQAERLAELEMSPLADALKALLAIAEETFSSKSATEDERRLAERLIDAHGPSDDCWTIRDSVAYPSRQNRSF